MTRVQLIGIVASRRASTLRSSRVVPHPSTDRALRRLTSEVGRDPVHSTRYGRQRTCCIPNAASLGGPSYQASVPWSLDAVMCCVAVCYHKYMEHVALAPSCALDYAHPSQQARMAGLLFECEQATHQHNHVCNAMLLRLDQAFKLTWLVLGEDPAARSHRVEQFTAL